MFTDSQRRHVVKCERQKLTSAERKWNFLSCYNTWTEITEQITVFQVEGEGMPSCSGLYTHTHTQLVH